MIYVFIYLAAIVLANFIVLWFGPAATIVNAFLLIGLDLTLRDKLHERWHGKNLWTKMLLLILAGSVITFLLNQDTYRIALASVVAFSGAAIIDTFVYSLLFKKKFMVKANGSNIFAALTDSALFPTIAFASFMPGIILGQFFAKILGGFIWSYIIVKLREVNKPAPNNSF
jgi:hypothetical protein